MTDEDGDSRRRKRRTAGDPVGGRRGIVTFLLRCLSFILAPVMPLLERLLFALLSLGPVPRHIAIIMDGNRRYARTYPGGPIPVSQGHMSGFNALRSVLETCLNMRGMTTISVYAFAINNFARDKAEVNALMDLAKRNLIQLAAHREVLARHSVRLRMVGRKDLLPADVRTALDKVERMTEGNRRATLNVCIAYASSDEIANAVQRCIDRRTVTINGVNGHEASVAIGRSPEQITIEQLDAEMMLAHSPPVDILIRTSDVHRFSDFMLWQSSEAQLQFTRRYWPLFGLRELIPIMLDYQQMAARRWLEGRVSGSAR